MSSARNPIETFLAGLPFVSDAETGVRILNLSILKLVVKEEGTSIFHKPNGLGFDRLYRASRSTDSRSAYSVSTTCRLTFTSFGTVPSFGCTSRLIVLPSVYRGG